MKKVLFLFVLLFLSNAVLARDYNAFCSTNVPKKTISGVLFSTSGINLTARSVIQHILEAELEKETKSKFDVKLETFYGANIKEGEFKSLDVEGRDAEIEGIYLSNIKANSICPYNKVSYVGEQLYFDENFVLKFSADISQNDVDKMDSDNPYKKILNKTINSKMIISNYKSVLPALYKFSYNIKLDNINKGKLDITNVQINKGIAKLEGYVVINKSPVR